MATSNEIIVSAHQDGSPFLVVGAGISPRGADIIFTSRDTAGGGGPLSTFIANELGVPVRKFWQVDELGDYGVSEILGPRLVAHLTTVDGVSKTDKLLTGNMRRLLYGPLNEVFEVTADQIVWIPLMGTGAGGLSFFESADLIGLVLATYFAETDLNLPRFKKILISGPPEMSPDDLDAIAKVFGRYNLRPPTQEPKGKIAQSPTGTSTKQSPASDAPQKSDFASQFDGVFDDEEALLEPSKPTLEQAADFRSDRPVTSIKDDALDRAAIARAIFDKVHTFWTEGDGPPPKYPFMVHIAGRWGSGKSTILNFLGETLRQDESLTPPLTGQVGETRKNWVVVDFNAWQHQAQRPAWWSLYNAVADQAASQLDRHHSFTYQDRKFRFLINGGYVTMMAAITVVVLSLGLLGYGFWTSGEPQDVTSSVELTTTTVDSVAPDTAATTVEKTVERRVEVTEKPVASNGNWDILGKIPTIATILAALIAIGAVVQKFLQRTQDIADALIASDDPTAQLKKRFEDMIREIHRPVAIFIDDLDRCDADYVIELLQAVQTIYVDVPVLYVVAADRDWIVSAYDQSYKDFKSDIDQPGQPLGYLFVKKIFQLSVNIPDLDSEYGRTFLRAQLKGSADDQVTPEDQIRIQDEIKAAPSLAAAQVIVERQATPAAKRVAGSASFEKYMTAEAQLELQHLLLETLAGDEMLLDPNPRAIKRLVNAYSFRSGFALIAGQTDVIPKLPYWCALDLRFPYSAERLGTSPILAAEDAWKEDGMSRDKDGILIGTNWYFPIEDHSEIAKLLAHLTADDITALRVYG